MADIHTWYIINIQNHVSCLGFFWHTVIVVSTSNIYNAQHIIKIYHYVVPVTLGAMADAWLIQYHM